ncbi:MAG: hypothetical protein IJS07_05945 [Bacteroidales bacterium]|nr:hypothetical protein [Bacteroidales bacterium]
MKIIVESGATKSDWCLICPDGSIRRIKTGGINISTMPKEDVERVVSEAFTRLSITPSMVKEVHFYAAGMLGNEMFEYFPYSYVECASDLLGAARALFGQESGVAAILGTGSNCGLYEGGKIVRNVKSGGFILGDEGSAACLGKLFISDFLKELVPEDIARDFAAEFKADYPTIVANVYKGATPSAYLGGFAPWIMARYEGSAYIQQLVEQNLRSFFVRSAGQFGDRPVGIVGGFAKSLEDIIRRIASEIGVEIREILASPADKLIDFHRQ